VTTYVGKPSATGLSTRRTQPFIFSRSINWVVSCNRMFVSSHGATIWWMLTGWRPGVVHWSGGACCSCSVALQHY